MQQPYPTDQVFGLVEAALPHPDLTVSSAGVVEAGRGAALRAQLERALEQLGAGGAVVLLRHQALAGVAGALVDVVGVAMPEGVDRD